MRREHFQASPFSPTLEGRSVPLRSAFRMGQAWEGICAEMSADEYGAIIEEKQAAWEEAGKSTLDEACAIVDGEFRQYCWYPNGNRGQTSGTDTTPEEYISCADNWAQMCSVAESEGGTQGHPACPDYKPAPEPAPVTPPPTPSLSPPPQAPPQFPPVPSTPLPPQPLTGPAAPFQTGCTGQSPIPRTPLNAFGLGFGARSIF